MYVQVIDDGIGETLVSVSSLDAMVKEQRNGKSKSNVAGLVGTLVAECALEKGIKSVVFDRGGYQYHGRVKAVADAARKGGLSF